jgi:hypothetical protein
LELLLFLGREVGWEDGIGKGSKGTSILLCNVLFLQEEKIFFYSFIHMCIHCLGHYFPQPLHPHPLLPNPPHFQAEPVLPLSLILLKRRHKHNKKDRVFLLDELRTAIQRDS